MDDDLEEMKIAMNDFHNKETLLINEKTFFEIAGFPSRENVFSNILKFYFDNRNKQHGFDSLILKALLLHIREFNDIDLSVKQIRREVTTKNYNRIDLVIETNNSVIAIENKVYHVLANDLKDYSTFLEENYYERKKIRIVLNLTVDKDTEDENEFIFISYKTFLENLKKASLPYNSSNKFQVFFYEFMQNIKNHFPAMLTEEQLQFIVENEERIDKIKELSSRATNYISLRSAEILKKVGYSQEKWYEYREIAYSFEIHSKNNLPFVKVACTIEISKIYIEVSSDNKDVLHKLKIFLVDKSKVNLEFNRDWLYITQFFPIISKSNEEVAESIRQLLNVLEQFIITFENNQTN